MKTSIRTILEENYIQQINKIILDKKLTKNDFFEIALNEFIKKNDKQTYTLKFNNFERISTRNFIIAVFNPLSIKFRNLAEKLNLTQTQLFREIIIYYLEKKSK
ncbi:MAG: hypothetical protein IPH62_13850 [Ignavibacteriae bacterium]|nr:hypothetical protein [Ignavibacteriota bacterium]